MSEFNNKVAVVTGATSGIGRATAIAFARKSARLVAAGRRENEGNELVAPRVPMMIYLGKAGSGEQMPIELTGVFTDQGVVNEQTVGKPVCQRTVIHIDSNDRHFFELYFKPPEGKEQLALRMVYTRIK